MVKVPSGFRVKEICLKMTSITLSAGGAVNMVFTVGDGGDPNRYMSASLATNTAFRLGHNITVASGDQFYRYSENDTIDVTITGITGTDSASQTTMFNMSVFGSIDD